MKVWVMGIFVVLMFDVFEVILVNIFVIGVELEVVLFVV